MGNGERGRDKLGRTPSSVESSGRDESPVLENMPPVSFEELLELARC